MSFVKIKTAAALIRKNPLNGNIPDELQTPNITTYRQILVGMNRIIYEPRADTIYIHIVCDSRRTLAGLPMRRLVNPDSQSGAMFSQQEPQQAIDQGRPRY